MIHFNNEKEIPNTFFGGSEQKRAYEIDGRIYMVKFPDPVRQKKNALSYMNNQFSEYIGCHIFRALGIPAQNTFLGDYQTEAGKSKKQQQASHFFEMPVAVCAMKTLLLFN